MSLFEGIESIYNWSKEGNKVSELQNKGRRGNTNRTNGNIANIDNKGLTRSAGENTKEFICNSKVYENNTTIKGLNKMIETNRA
ncbi:hypothetical protein SDC9_202111 [bioreactor metagenome]|uniref:Uncharacterized protein n=1 Tax=bioreactor metagenome TaxID=1076179 RepID=A0A645IST0_9ZZZZ